MKYLVNFTVKGDAVLEAQSQEEAKKSVLDREGFSADLDSEVNEIEVTNIDLVDNTVNRKEERKKKRTVFGVKDLFKKYVGLENRYRKIGEEKDDPTSLWKADLMGEVVSDLDKLLKEVI